MGICIVCREGYYSVMGVRCAGAVDVDELFHRDQRDKFLVLGGIFTIIAGILSLVNGVEGFLTDTSLFSFLPDYGKGVTTYCGVLLILFGVIAIAGGVYALRPGAHITPMLIGAAMGMLGGGVYGFLLGVAAMLASLLANSDF
jgi:hypothetical protein